MKLAVNWRDWNKKCETPQRSGGAGPFTEQFASRRTTHTNHTHSESQTPHSRSVRLHFRESNIDHCLFWDWVNFTIFWTAKTFWSPRPNGTFQASNCLCDELFTDLRIEDSVGIGPVLRILVQAIVGAARVVQINVADTERTQQRNCRENLQW